MGIGILGLICAFLPRFGPHPTPVSWAIFNIFVGSLLIIPLVPVHELGHVVAGRLLGGRVLRVRLGTGALVREWKILDLALSLHRYPFSGYTHVFYPEAALFRLKAFLIYLAGPLSTALMFVACLLLIPEKDLIGTVASDGFAPFWSLTGACLLITIINLIPFHVQTDAGLLPNDALGCWRSITMKTAQVEAFREAHFAGLIHEYLLQEDQVSAGVWLERALRKYPSSFSIRFLKAFHCIHQDQQREAMEEYRRLLELKELEPVGRALLNNNLAWLLLVVGDAPSLAEADSRSQEAYVDLPWMEAIRGTRGAVLIELGRIDEGLPLVVRSLKTATETSLRASMLCSLVIGLAAKREIGEAQSHLSLARKLDPKSSLLGRAAQRLADAKKAI